MPTSVRLDLKTERTLERLARRRRTSKSAILREAVDALARRSLADNGRAGGLAKFQHVIGCVSSGRGDLSTRTGQGFRRILEQKRQR
jgi:ribbon-helix-helix CopG family protein